MKTAYQICISGAAKGPSVKLATAKAEQTGREIIRLGHVVTTGATDGLPYFAAQAARAAKPGAVTSIGFSPAPSPLAHVKRYRLPTDAFDTIIYTGFGYSGRNLLMVRSSDAVVMIGGRIGTLNEVTIALQEKTPLGILLGSGGMTDEVEHVLKVAKRSRAGIIFDDDPIGLLDSLLELVEQRYRKVVDKHKRNVA